EIAAAHHGSVARENRLQIEDRLKQGQLPAIVATSSLELGIDMGAVDLVIQIEAPSSIASGIQRIGRAGHQVGVPSRGVIFPKFRGDLLACSAAAARMQDGEVEQTFYPRNPLDVVAQQIVAMVALEPVSADDLYATLRSAAPCFDLARSLFDDVLDLLSGRYPSDEFAGLRPRITWDRISGEISPRRGTQRIAVTNAGTIPDRGLYGVFLAEGIAGGGSQPSRVGELDEEMVFEMRPGDVFLLGASSWRVLDITRDRVLVAPAPGETGRMPFWRGDGLGRPLEFGQAIGSLTRQLLQQEEPAALAELETRHCLDPRAARNLLTYLHSQAEATGHVPTDRTIVLESFVDEVGDWRVAVLTPFGLRVHTPWAMAIAARLREGMAGDNEIDLMWNDDGMVFRLPESDEPPGIEQLLFAAEEIEPAVVRELGSTALFAARFRENAARALLLPRRSPGKRTPLWLQRRKSADLLNVAARYERFPILLETYRECLRDVFDMAGLKSILREIEQHSIQVIAVRTEVPSPFAASLLFSYTGNFLYNGDAPLAERRAAALSLDHAQLRELLGDAELRDLLDAEVIREYVLQLQRLDGKYPPAEADDLHELLRQLGDLTRDELRQRCSTERTAAETETIEPETRTETRQETEDRITPWLDSLLAQQRLLEVSIAGERRLVAAEDAARVRVLPEVELPPALPAAFLESLADPLGDLISRFARTHGPFQVEEPAVRLGISPEEVLATLERLAAQGRVVDGEFLPGGRGREWCDAGVLRTLRQRSLARLRKQVEPVDGETFTKFLLDWQAIRRPGKSLDGLLDAIEQLQGLALPASDLERKILPARVEDYSPRLLDELCMAGEIVWRGVDPLGRNDGRVALYLTDDASQLLPPLEEVEDVYDRQLLDALASRGGLFFEELCRELGDFPNDVLQHLWRLVWAGYITNDTLTPLRSLLRQSSQSGSPSHPGQLPSRSSRSRRPGRREFRSRRTATASLAGSEGRWSLASRHLARHLGETEETEITPTERLTALAAQLIERYGVVTRELVAAEGIPGGFSALYPVFRAMEEAGRVRRGYFIAGQGAAQFAAPGADDRLRNQREPWRKQHARTLVLAATDPASPFGSALKWPGQNPPDTPDSADTADDLSEPGQPPDEQPADQPLKDEDQDNPVEDDSATEESSTGARPQRAAGAQVIISEGQLLAWVSRSRKQLLTFLPAAEPEREQARQELLKSLPAAGISWGRLKQLTIDGKPASESGLLPSAD
ncbi:MAG: hypothetical protein KDA79_04025, partial [Planctomycetaceae bacterium]|nr:hypothetical protein [Planctomycetaceae bacterium]